MSAGAQNSSRNDPLAGLREAVGAAAAEVAGAEAPPRGVALERPKNQAHGDFATNAAMVCAPIARDNPRNVADGIAAKLADELGDLLTSAEVAGPGFLNLRLSDAWYGGALGHVLGEDAFGSGVAPTPERINVEFPSANPTGPMHIGHGRNAAYGDSLCRVLKYAGHEVSREYYSNDFGTQVERFGASIAARAAGSDVPEDGYQGEYIDAIAKSIPGAAGMTAEELQHVGVEKMLAMIGETLTRMGVEIDVWFSERSLHQDDRFERAIETLREAGHIYEHDDAVWLRTSELGDDKDRVLRRSNGDYTYFATDIAYHQDKRQRGFDRLIDIWGADHHGYIQRMKAAYAALGGDPDTFEPVIMQLVNLTENGQRVQMSKRSGEFVTVDDLIDDIGADALRFFLVQRSHETTMDLDLALAREQSDKNPVYYVQYAHARINSILEKAGIGTDAGLPTAIPELHESERALIRRLIEFPDEIAETAFRRSPHRLTIYGREVAAEFSAFYRDCKVVGEADDVTQFRVGLCVAARSVLAQTLDLLGVSAPERM
ncbi:MAG: arginine--tRNA ligase [Thermoleophilaceae bacterium]|nr:arginine--tRNA ligase [Thermoleophilaceae bacterium]